MRVFAGSRTCRTWSRSAAPRASDGVAAGLAGADADRLLDAGYEDLAVADAPSAGRRLDRLDRAFGQRVLDHDLELHLGQEIDDVFRAAVELRMALLAAEALGDRKSVGSGKSVSVRVDLGVSRIIKQNNQQTHTRSN